ncbi:unnamed protein product [Prorocentrum cordatum]|uniref:Uncharacterized protein n=1 Tax=Prorocentrum cordatum TaxID=2364126 RepID=A0ABN9QCC3_9DINO|nr:unnamed protein product [Polarella glacialis]
MQSAKSHLRALEFLGRRPAYQASPCFQAWAAYAPQARAARREAGRALKELLRSGAPAEQLEEAAARAEEAEADPQALGLVRKVAQNRRGAHEHALRALQLQRLHELDAARSAVEAAGGPVADLPLLDTAIVDCEADEDMLEEWDVSISVAVSRCAR